MSGKPGTNSQNSENLRENLFKIVENTKQTRDTRRENLRKASEHVKMFYFEVSKLQNYESV